MGRRRRKKSNKGREEAARERLSNVPDGVAAGVNEFDDEIDAFHTGRDRVLFGGDGGDSNRRRRNGANGDEDDDEEEERVLELDLAGSSDDDDDDDGVDDGDQSFESADSETRRLEEELARHLRRTKGLRKSKIEARSSDESSSDDDGQDGRAHDPEAIRRKAEVMGGAWGGDRSTYYDADAVHSDDDDLAEEEEAAAREQRRMEAALLDEDDFGADGISLFAGGASLNTAAPESKAAAKKRKKEERRRRRKERNESEAAAAAALGFGAVAGAGGAAVERVERNLAELSASERLAILADEAPEVLELLADLQAKVAEIRASVRPVLDRAADGDVPTSAGLSFLEVKHQLLLSYCINICFYLLLRAEGRPVRSHPVVGELVRIRATIERLAPLDKKLKYQIDKLLRVAATGKARHAGAAVGDPLAHKANPGAIDVDDMDDDADDSDGALEGGAGGAYVAPKTREVRLGVDESAEARAERKADRIRRKAASSAMLKSLAAEFGDAPEERLMPGETDLTLVDEIEEGKTQWEENNFVRLAVSNKEMRKKQKKQLRSGSAIDDFEDFSSLAALDRLASAKSGSKKDKSSGGSTGVDAAEAKRKKRLHHYINEIDQETKRGRRNRAGGDDDLPQREERVAAAGGDKKRKRDADAGVALGEGGDDNDDFGTDFGDLFGDAFSDEDGGGRSSKRQKMDNPFYDEIAALKAGRKAADGWDGEAPEGEFGDEFYAATDDRRGATWQMVKNKGLTPHRSKLVRNPRKKYRVKYEKAVVRRRGAVRSMRDKSAPYAGEKTGIKSNISRSTKFR